MRLLKFLPGAGVGGFETSPAGAAGREFGRRIPGVAARVARHRPDGDQDLVLWPAPHPRHAVRVPHPPDERVGTEVGVMRRTLDPLFAGSSRPRSTRGRCPDHRRRDGRRPQRLRGVARDFHRQRRADPHHQDRQVVPTEESIRMSDRTSCRHDALALCPVALADDPKPAPPAPPAVPGAPPRSPRSTRTRSRTRRRPSSRRWRRSATRPSSRA